MDPLHQQADEAWTIFPFIDAESSEPKVHLDKESDSSSCSELVSDCVSPSFSSTDQEQPDVWNLNWKKFSLDFILSSTISDSRSSESILDKSPVFDGSQVSPIEEACITLGRTLEDKDNVFTEDLQEGEIVTWLNKSMEDESPDPSNPCYEILESSHDFSLCDDSSVFESSSTSVSVSEDSASTGVWDSDRTDNWISLLDLHGEDFEMTLLKEDIYDNVFDSPDFPSPSYKMKPANHALVNECEEKLHLDADEPLFWPFDPNSCCYPKVAWNGLCISPRRDLLKIENPDSFCPRKPIRLQVLERNKPTLELRNAQGNTRRTICSSRTRLSNLSSSKTDVRVSSKGPSRLAYGTRGGHPCELQSRFKETRAFQEKGMGDHRVKPTNPRTEDQYKAELSSDECEEFPFQGFAQADEVPIERLIGLNEFDGHEGITDAQELDERQFLVE